MEHQEFEERLKQLVGDSKVAQEVFGEILARAARQLRDKETTRLHLAAEDPVAQRSVDRRKIPQATVSRAVNALLKEGLLEGGSSRLVGKDNRRLSTLRFGRRFLIAGVDVELRGKGGPEYVTAALIGLDNRRVLAHSREKVPTKGSRWDNAASLVSRELKKLLERLNEARAVIGEDSTEFAIFGVGVEIPAPVNDGEVTLVPTGEKEPIPFRSKVRKALSENGFKNDLPILIENDVNALAVLAAREAKYEHPDLVVASVFKEGVGGGLVMDGRLRRGGNGMAMEIGHLPVSVPGNKVSPWGDVLRSADDRDPTEPEGFFDLCWCGQHLHVDTFAAPSRIEGQLQLQLQVRDYRKAATSRGTCATDEATDTGDSIRFTDTGEIFRKAGAALGRALAHTCNIVNPSSLVVYLPRELYRPSGDDLAAEKFDETAAGQYFKAASDEITTTFANKDRDLESEGYLNFVPLPSEPDELAILLARAAAACVFESFIEHALKLDGCMPAAEDQS